MNDDQKIDLYRQSLLRAWGFRDYNDWPVKLNSVFHLFLEEFGEEFWSDLKYLEEEKKMSLQEISMMFNNPARIYRLIDFLIFGFRRKHRPLEFQRKMVLKLLSMVKALKYGSEFNEDGKNIIYNPEKVSQVASKLSKSRCNLEESALIHRFCGLLWAYTEAIFFRAHDLTKEIHGPYFLNEQYQNIIVKEYLNLRPQEIWPGAKLIPVSTIKIFKDYDPILKLSIDSLNHIYHLGGNYIPNIKNYYIEIDGKEGTAGDLNALIPVIAQVITENVSVVDRMSWNEKVLKYSEIFWYRKKTLREATGKSWQIPQVVREQIYSGSANPKRIERLSEEQVCRLAMITI